MNEEIKVAIDMAWLRCEVMTTFEAIDAISHVLEQFKITGVQIAELKNDQKTESNIEDDVQLIFYIQKEDTTPKVLKQIQTNIKKLSETYNINIGSACFSTETLADGWDTTWKKYYQPIKISDAMTIVPTWKKSSQQTSSEVVIELDPGLAFGTGSHPSTILSLRALEKYVTQEQVVIDVGSGSGILSIAALLLGAKEVVAIDNDKQAVKSTLQNARLNHVDDSLTVIEGDLLQNLQLEANLIVANILAEVIIKFAKDAYNRLTDRGYFITSGIIKRKQQLVINTLEKALFTIIEIIDLDNWVCIVAQKQTK